MSFLDRRRFLQISGVATTLATLPPAALALAQAARTRSATHDRGWMIYVDPRLGAKGDAYRRRIIAAAATSPLLAALSSGKPPSRSTNPVPAPEELSFNHVILLALPDDPLLKEAWQREAVIPLAPEADKVIYAFGFGHLKGSIAYLESDRNPFLHSSSVEKAPYEAQWISLTGTDQIGLDIAVDAFLAHGLVNGLVAAPGWERGRPTLLDRDPLQTDFTIPAVIPMTLGSLHRIAVTQVAEDEYRGTLADIGRMPRSIWQAKYYAPGQWDASGQIASFHNYAVGLHRRAYGNSVWVATFTSPLEAASVAPRIAAAARLTASSGHWTGYLPPYAWGNAEMGDGPTTGILELYVEGSSVLLTTQSRLL